MVTILYIVAALLAVLIIGLVIVVVRLSRQAPTMLESRNRRRGKHGEELVAQVLGKDIEGVRRVLTNYRFFRGDKVREVDHILIDARGVFVIETKNWKGKVFGHDDDESWTQILGNDDIVHAHENPVRQNSGHVYHLRGVLKGVLPEGLWLNALVVFVQNNVEHIESDDVVALSVLQSKLESFPEGALSAQDIERIYAALLAARYRE